MVNSVQQHEKDGPRSSPEPPLGSEDLFKTIKASIREYENGIDELEPQLELKPRESGWSTEPDEGIPGAQDGDGGANGQSRYINGIIVQRGSVQERDSGSARLESNSLSNGVADIAGRTEAPETQSGHLNGHLTNGQSASMTSRSGQQVQHQVGQDSSHIHGYSAIPQQQEQEGEPIIPETSPEPVQDQEPRVKIEDPPSSPPPARYKVYPTRYDSGDSGDEEEEEDELDDSDGASSSTDDDARIVPVVSSTARKTQRPPAASSARARIHSSEDDEGSEKTESETSENERVASQLIIGSGANTPQRRVANPRRLSAVVSTPAPTSGHPASTPAHRAAPPRRSPSRDILFDGKFLASYPALLSTVSEALNVPTSRIWSKDSFQADEEGRAEKVWTLVCPRKDCGAGVRTVRTDAGEEGNGEMWKIIGHSTRHARHCPYSSSDTAAAGVSASFPSTAPGAIDTTHSTVPSQPQAAGEAGPSVHNQRGRPPRTARGKYWSSYFHTQILMPPRKKGPNWTAGACCKACIEFLIKEQGENGPLTPSLKRIQRGSSTKNDIELVSQLKQWKLIAVHLTAMARVRHIAKNCLAPSSYDPEVRQAAARELEVKRQNEASRAVERAARATSLAAPPREGNAPPSQLPGGSEIAMRPNGVHSSAVATSAQPTGLFGQSMAGLQSAAALRPAPPHNDNDAPAIEMAKNRAFAAKLLKRDPNSLHVDGRKFRCPNWDAIDEKKAPFAINSFSGNGNKVYTYCPPVHGCPALAERSDNPLEMAWSMDPSKFEHSEFCKSIPPAEYSRIRHWTNPEQKAQAIAAHLAKNTVSSKTYKVPQVSVTAASPAKSAALAPAPSGSGSGSSSSERRLTPAEQEQRSNSQSLLEAIESAPGPSTIRRSASIAALRTPSPSAFEDSGLPFLGVGVIYSSKRCLLDACSLYLKQDLGTLNEHLYRKEYTIRCCNFDAVIGDQEKQEASKEYTCDALVVARGERKSKNWEITECQWKHSDACTLIMEQLITGKRQWPSSKGGSNGLLSEEEELQRVFEFSCREAQEQRLAQGRGGDDQPIASGSGTAHFESDEAMARRLAFEDWGEIPTMEADRDQQPSPPRRQLEPEHTFDPDVDGPDAANEPQETANGLTRSRSSSSDVTLLVNRHPTTSRQEASCNGRPAASLPSLSIEDSRIDHSLVTTVASEVKGYVPLIGAATIRAGDLYWSGEALQKIANLMSRAEHPQSSTTWMDKPEIVQHCSLLCRSSLHGVRCDWRIVTDSIDGGRIKVIKVLPRHSNACFASYNAPIPEETQRFRLYKTSKSPAIPVNIEDVAAESAEELPNGVDATIAAKAPLPRPSQSASAATSAGNPFNATSVKSRPNGVHDKPRSAALNGPVLTNGAAPAKLPAAGITSVRTDEQEHIILRENPLFAPFYEPYTPQSKRLVTAIGARDHKQFLEVVEHLNPHDLRKILLDLALGRQVVPRPLAEFNKAAGPPAAPNGAISDRATEADVQQREESPELPEPVKSAVSPAKVAVGHTFETRDHLQKAAQRVSQRHKAGTVVEWDGDSIQCRCYGKGSPITCRFRIECQALGGDRLRVTRLDHRHGENCHLEPEDWPAPAVPEANAPMEVDVPDAQPQEVSEAGPSGIEQSGQPTSSSDDETSVFVSGSQPAAQNASIGADGFAIPKLPASSSCGPLRLTHRNLQRLREDGFGSPRRAPSTVASEISTVASPRKRAKGEPRKPKKRAWYNSEQDFRSEVKAYSKMEAPHVKLYEPKTKGVYIIRCTNSDCSFYVEAEHLKDKDDGSELQGVIVKKSKRHHIEACKTAQSTPSRAASSIFFERKRKAGSIASSDIAGLDSPNRRVSPTASVKRDKPRAKRRKIASSPVADDIADFIDDQAAPPDATAGVGTEAALAEPAAMAVDADMAIEDQPPAVQLRPPGLTVSHKAADSACDPCRIAHRKCEPVPGADSTLCRSCQKLGLECKSTFTPAANRSYITFACEYCREYRTKCAETKDPKSQRFQTCYLKDIPCSWEQRDQEEGASGLSPPVHQDVPDAEAPLARTVTPPALDSAPVVNRSPPKAPATNDSYATREAFNNAVQAHSSSVNPGSQLAFTQSDDFRFRAACLRPQCSYSFNASMSGLAGPDATVIVRRNTPKHSDSCLAWYRDVRDGTQEATVDAPQVGTEIEDWNDFVEQVKYHSNYLNEGCELRVAKQNDLCRVWCPERDLGCKYLFSAQFVIANLHEGSVEVRKAVDKHSMGCWNHHQRTVKNLPPLEENLSDVDETKTRGTSRSRSKGKRRESAIQSQAQQDDPTAPKKGDVFDSREHFKQIVEEHTARVNPGSSVAIKDRPLSYSLECKNYYTGCRYEFYCIFEDPRDPETKLILDSVTPFHHEMCVAELVLRKLRPPPPEEIGRRTRRAARPVSFTERSISSASASSAQLAGPSAKAKGKGKKVMYSDSGNDSGSIPHRSPRSSNEASPFVDVRDGVVDTGVVPPRTTNAPFLASSGGHLDSSRHQRPTRQVRLLTEVLPARSADFLGSLRYATIADLDDLGMTKSEWPIFVDWLAEKSSKIVASEDSGGGLNAVECFLLARRANNAIAEEEEQNLNLLAAHVVEDSEDEQLDL